MSLSDVLEETTSTRRRVPTRRTEQILILDLLHNMVTVCSISCQGWFQDVFLEKKARNVALQVVVISPVVSEKPDGADDGQIAR